MSTNEEQLGGLVERLERRTAAFLGELDGLEAAQLDFRPQPGKWSALEVGHHLMLIEKGILSEARKPGKPVARSLRDFFGHLAVKAVLRFDIPVKAPSRSLEPRDPITVEELRDEWLAIRRELVEAVYALEDDEQLFRHPFAGPLDGRRGLEFVLSHFDHHMRQVERIRRHVAFP